MLQSSGFSQLLFAIALLFYTHAGSARVNSATTAPGKREKLYKIFSAEVGVRERTGNNDGTEVEKYLRYVRLSKGDPWCAAFVCWALGRAGVVNPRSGWSPALFPESRICWRRDGRLTWRGGRQSADVPSRGDVFGIYFHDKKRVAHCGFVDVWMASWVITVEGNTNVQGSREGDGVYRKRRLIRTLHAVADWIEGS